MGEVQPNLCYNIASRAAQSNSVYVSVLKIPIVHADSVSKSLRQKFFFFARAAMVSAGKIIYFATMMDTTDPVSPKTKTIFQPFPLG